MKTLAVSLTFRWLITLLFPVFTILVLFVLFDENVRLLILQLQNNIQEPILIAMIIILLLTLDVLLPIPSSILSAFAIASLGVELGAITIWIGLTFGAILGYFIGTKSLRFLKNRFLDEKSLNDAKRLGKSIGLGTLVSLRAVPILAEVSVISAGLVSIPFWKFIIVTSLANAGVAAAYMYSVVYFGNGGFWLAFIAGIAVPTFAWGNYHLFLFFKEKVSQLFKEENSVFIKDQISVEFSISYNYPVLFGESFFSQKNNTLENILLSSSKTIQKVLVYVDSGISDANKYILNDIELYFRNKDINLLSVPIIIKGGESCKSKKQIELLYSQMLEHNLDRHSCVIAIGGGAVLDAIGYATSTFHRGVELIRMPSTVLAQNDAGVGVKNGFNYLDVKNLIGTFTTPLAVLNDKSFLTTLSKRDQIAGLAEAIKVALIRNEKLFDWIEEKHKLLKNGDLDILTYGIKECANEHLKQITSGDPFESGNSRPLDYGHWSAHWLESQTNYELRHGEAVAIGMLLDARYSFEMGWISKNDLLRLENLLKVLGFELWHESLLKKSNKDELLLFDAIESFRQHLGGKLCLSMLTSIGKAIEIDTINKRALIDALNWLKVRE